ncbi:MAG: hypothetical protein SGI74_06280, partial [Oligoflexia bacterium]|nr:hypothetical protein [Oligoflexia bacterium]
NRSQTGINVRLSELSKGYYTISFIAYDQAQNQSAATTTRFCVYECPPPAPYCAGDALPQDGCGDDCPGILIPPGTGCPTTDTYCPDAVPNDDCNDSCPASTRPNGTGCPSPCGGNDDCRRNTCTACPTPTPTPTPSAGSSPEASASPEASPEASVSSSPDESPSAAATATPSATACVATTCIIHTDDPHYCGGFSDDCGVQCGTGQCLR